MTWALTTALALITLQALVSQGASGRIGALFADVDHLVERALDPTVPAIPDRRTGTSAPTSGDETTGTGKTLGPLGSTTSRLPVVGIQRAV